MAKRWTCMPGFVLRHPIALGEIIPNEMKNELFHTITVWRLLIEDDPVKSLRAVGGVVSFAVGNGFGDDWRVKI